MAVRALVKMNFAPENTTTPAPSLRGYSVSLIDIIFAAASIEASP